MKEEERLDNCLSLRPGTQQSLATQLDVVFELEVPILAIAREKGNQEHAVVHLWHYKPTRQ